MPDLTPANDGGTHHSCIKKGDPIAQTVVVVAPFSSGVVFARRAKELYGLDSVAVLTPDMAPLAPLNTSYVPEEYLGEVHFSTVAETARRIEGLCGGRPDFIICGSEPGVEEFDALAAHWGMRANSGVSEARRDKFLMQACLRDAGVRYIPHHKASDTESIVRWCARSGLAGYVVKPLKSFATDGVFFCSDLDEVRAACERLFGRTDLAGHVITEVLVQERISGPEFVVDSVSLDGSHFIVNMFRYAKETVDGNPMYRSMSAVDIGDHPEIVAYVERALSALGIDNGPAHTELILAEDGPVLIETGARMHGGLGPRLVEESSSHSLIDLTLASRIAPDDYRRQTRVRPSLRQHIVECFLSAPATGTLTANRVREMSQELGSYLFDTCHQIPGDRIERTVDLITSYGRVVLANADRAALERDRERVLEMDWSGVFIDIAPEVSPAPARVRGRSGDRTGPSGH
jgi:biotin carboxylase